MKHTALFALFVLFFSCTKKEEVSILPPDSFFYRAADMSSLPLIESEGTVYKDNNTAQDPLLTLKNVGCNTIRLRLWHNPTDGHCGFNEVKAFAQRVKLAGLKVWLTVHYSDTWADPGQQTKPNNWQSLNFNALQNSVAAYTAQIMSEIQPDIIQIGNETNDGMLWPDGKLSINEAQYVQLVNTACAAVRSKSTTTKIMLHYAGLTGSDWYYNKVAAVDYDYIGLSYYPIWHGTSLDNLQNTINSLGQHYNKKVIIAETAYPFTLGYDDYTNNIVGLNNQLYPGFSASPNGQQSFLNAIKNRIKQSNYGLGFCYWGAEWVAFRGPTATNGSPWENQALWDFNNNALPAMNVFNPN